MLAITFIWNTLIATRLIKLVDWTCPTCTWSSSTYSSYYNFSFPFALNHRRWCPSDRRRLSVLHLFARWCFSFKVRPTCIQSTIQRSTMDSPKIRRMMGKERKRFPLSPAESLWHLIEKGGCFLYTSYASCGQYIAVYSKVSTRGWKK